MPGDFGDNLAGPLLPLETLSPLAPVLVDLDHLPVSGWNMAAPVTVSVRRTCHSVMLLSVPPPPFVALAKTGSSMPLLSAMLCETPAPATCRHTLCFSKDG